MLNGGMSKPDIVFEDVEEGAQVRVRRPLRQQDIDAVRQIADDLQERLDTEWVSE